MKCVGQVICAMIDYYAEDVKRINHFLKVYGFAKAIGELEGIDQRTQCTLEIAALTHDIGIRNSEQKYKSAAGHYQQIEGPPEAEKLLLSITDDAMLKERVCYLIAHHHSYDAIQGIDHRILVKADFLVNIHEGNVPSSSLPSIRKNIFRTAAGTLFFDKLYGANIKR